MKKRIKELDIIKALCIIFMVIGHTSWEYMGILLLFHMAVFFMVSGYLFREENAVSIKKIVDFIIKRIKRLYIPWVIAHSIYLICTNLFFRLGFLTDDPAFLKHSLMRNYFGLTEPLTISKFFIEEIKILLMGGGTQFGGSLWFLRALLLVEITYAVIVFLANKIHKAVLPMSVLILFALGRFFSQISFGQLDLIRIVLLQICIPTSAYYMGVLCRKYADRLELVYSKAGTFICTVLLLMLQSIGIHNDMSNGTMTSVWGYFVATIAGFVFCMGIAKIIQRSVSISKVMVYIGQNTMPILILHLLSFKLITYIQIILYMERLDLPEFSMASFPTLLNTGVWPFIYTITGVVIPLLINKLYQLVKQRISRFIIKKGIFDGKTI